jgi:hypothetical protein
MEGIEMFVLAAKDHFSMNYYTGKTYIVEGECYPCLSGDIKEAKRYTTRKRAENARLALNRKVGMNFMVEPE